MPLPFFMIRLLVVIALITAVPVQIFAQVSKAADQNPETRTIRLPALIPFRDGSLWGYADSTGTLKIKPKYKHAEPFENGVARVAETYWNLIDEKGNELVKQAYQHFYPADKGLIIVQNSDNQYGVLNLMGEEVVPVLYKKVLLEHLPDLGTTFINVTLEQPANRAEMMSTGRNIRYMYGLYNAKGKKILPVEYTEIRYLSDGLFGACKKNECTVINSEGSEIMPLKPYRPGNLKEGMLMLCKEQRCGFADKNGKVVIPLEYVRISEFSEGLASVLVNGKWGYMNKEGKLVISPQFDQAEKFRNGLAIVRKNGFSGLIDTQGNDVTDFSHYEVTNHAGPGMYNLTSTHARSTAYYQPETGKLLIPSGYNLHEGFQEGLAQVMDKNYKQGYINKAGELVIPIEYQQARPFYKGLAAVKKNDLWGAIDKTGKTVVPFGFQELEVIDAGIFKVGLKSGYQSVMLYGLANSKGEEILPVKYTRIEPFNNGLATLHQNRSSGVINTRGQLVIPPPKLPEGYKICGSWENGLIKICSDNREKDAYMDRYGKAYFSN